MSELFEGGNKSQEIFKKMKIFICEGVNDFDPYATGAYDSLNDVNFRLGSSFIKIA